MEDAAPLFGLAAMLFGSGFVIHALGYWWFRVRQLERGGTQGVTPPRADPSVAARLARIEQAIEAVALEVERIGEAQRFATGLRGEHVGAAALPPAAPGPDRDPAA